MKQHQRKARLAHELHERGALSVDLRDTLNLLNETRKATNYGGEDIDLAGRTTEGLYDEIDVAVAEAERAV